MSKHIVKCRICLQQFDTNELEKEKDWVLPQPRFYYHTSCYNDFCKKKKGIREKDLTLELDDGLWFDATYDYLVKDLKSSLNFTKFQNQWENFLKKGMTAKGMYFTLRYFYEIGKGDPRKNEDGIGIIPHIYNEATCYWGERNQRDKGICDRIVEQVCQSTKIQVKAIKQKRVKKIDKTIDLIDFGMEDDN